MPSNVNRGVRERYYQQLARVAAQSTTFTPPLPRVSPIVPATTNNAMPQTVEEVLYEIIRAIGSIDRLDEVDRLTGSTGPAKPTGGVDGGQSVSMI
jgi:hypothetical protein